MTVEPVDALRYVAALLKYHNDWIHDAIAGAGCMSEHDPTCCIDHDPELDTLDQLVDEIAELTAQYGPTDRYTDGRRVKTTARIQAQGMYTEHVWHPDATAETPDSWGGPLPHDPDTPSPGLYQVDTNPLTQDLHTCVITPLGDETR